MFKVRHLGAIAAAFLMAAGAMANNFRAADQVYLPAVGHLSGQSGTFITDIFISNVENDAVDISVIYMPTGSSTPASAEQIFRMTTLGANERRELKDFFVNTLHLPSGFGQLIFNACKANADCTPDPNTGVSPNFRNITVESRIYSIPAGSDPAIAATTGQLFSGIPWYDYASNSPVSVAAGLDSVFITGFRNTGTSGQAGTYRGNLGLVNASQFSTTNLVVTLSRGDGTQIGTPAQVTLGPLGHTQVNINSLFPTFAGSTATNAYVVITQNTVVPTPDATANGCGDGCGGFIAYGSILDNLSGDATTLESQFKKAVNSAALACIYLQCKGTVPIKRAVKH